MAIKKNKTVQQLDLLSAFREASALSAAIVFYPIIFLLLGVYADKKLQTTPLFIIIGIIAGLVSFAIKVNQLAKKARQLK